MKCTHARIHTHISTAEMEQHRVSRRGPKQATSVTFSSHFDGIGGELERLVPKSKTRERTRKSRGWCGKKSRPMYLEESLDIVSWIKVDFTAN